MLHQDTEIPTHHQAIHLLRRSLTGLTWHRQTEHLVANPCQPPSYANAPAENKLAQIALLRRSATCKVRYVILDTFEDGVSHVPRDIPFRSYFWIISNLIISYPPSSPLHSSEEEVVAEITLFGILLHLWLP